MNCMEVLDQWSDGTDGYAEIINGGIIENHVIITITSEFNMGFSFVVEIYGQ